MMGACIDAELRRTVINGVSAQIHVKLQERIEKEVTAVVKAEVEATLTAKISAYVEALLKQGEIHSGGKTINILEWIKNKFDNTQGWNSLSAGVAKVAKKHVDDMKLRYDRAFAVHVVDNMRKANLLKDENVAKLLEMD